MHQDWTEEMNQAWTKEVRTQRVNDTFSSYGHSIKANGKFVFLRTDEAKRVTPNGIILPESATSFYAGLGKGVTVWATVVAAQDKTDLKAGDRVLFERPHFGWLHKFSEDGTLLGFIKENNLLLVDQMQE